jgi:hypothetical protein
MFSFFKKNTAPATSPRAFSEAEKIAMVEAAYADYLKKMAALERERDEKFRAILKRIDERKVREIMGKVAA